MHSATSKKSLVWKNRPAQRLELNPIQHFWDELSAIVAEWEQIPAASFQSFVKSLPRRDSCPWFWNEMYQQSDVPVSTYFWPCIEQSYETGDY